MSRGAKIMKNIQIDHLFEYEHELRAAIKMIDVALMTDQKVSWELINQVKEKVIHTANNINEMATRIDWQQLEQNGQLRFRGM